MPLVMTEAISNSGRHFRYVKKQMNGINSICVAIKKHTSLIDQEQDVPYFFPLHLASFASSYSVCIEERECVYIYIASLLYCKMITLNTLLGLDVPCYGMVRHVNLFLPSCVRIAYILKKKFVICLMSMR
jgi:hypothetical protein